MNIVGYGGGTNSILLLFCPSMKRHEICTLYHKHRNLYDRATAMERGAMPNLISEGLGA